MISNVLVAFAWTVSFAFVSVTAAKGLRGGPVRLPFRSRAGHLTVTGVGARIAGVLFTLLGLVMLALPVLLVMDWLRSPK